MQTRVNNNSYIDTMYRTGGEFKYEYTGQSNGSHRYKLNSLEYKAKDLIGEMNQHKNSLNIMKKQSDSMKREFKETYNRLRKDISEEVTDFEQKFNVQFNQQKVKNAEINKELNELKNELLKTKNLLVELKDRAKALQLRVDGETGNS